ncbi:MAG: hypothetical protein IPG57_16990 [Burkholderiales bacterium]|nr:hypothetical protein [Burkholderiales bacterium]
MAYQTEMNGAAYRHFHDAQKLKDEHRMDNAAYHFGLAAECAVKHQLIAQHKVQTDHGAIWTHWPELRLQALDALHGRRAAPLRTMMQRDNYLQHWDIKMRYAATGSITTAQLERWRENADEAMGLLL